LAILDCFIERPGPVSLVELSQRAGIGLATTLRLVRTLEEAGYVRQDQRTKRYRLSWKLLQLHGATLAVLDYAQVAQPFLEELATRLGESTGMAVLDGMQVRYALRVGSPRLVTANVPPGAMFPPHATAMGKVLFATLDPEDVRHVPLGRFTDRTITDHEILLQHLAHVARQGYAISDGEWEPGLRSIAAPVRGADKRIIAAVCVLVVRPDAPAAFLESECLPHLLRTAAQISAELGFTPDSSG
jgi:IclR family pca regulon transcriptional regulator